MKKKMVIRVLFITLLMVLTAGIPLFSAQLLSDHDGDNTRPFDSPPSSTGDKDTVPPSITITFAGNQLDRGGPYYIPPLEDGSVSLDGYFTNDSRQSENSLVINCLVTDIDGVNTVWLQWLNETKWTNWTYKFRRIIGDNWQFNTLGQIKTAAGYR